MAAHGASTAGRVSLQLFIWFAGWLLLLVSFRGRTARQDWFARRLVSTIRSLGATYIKVGQIMSTRPDLLPPHVIRELESLQDNVGAFAFRHVERVVREDFGRGPEDIFSSFSRRPVASASVAQVHEARLPSGRRVAVKVRRPRIEILVGFDLAVMRMVARIIALRPAYRLLAPVESVNEFGRAIRTQIDFRIEGANNRRFRDNFHGDPDVEFPELVDELCSERVLTMSFIEGAKVLQADRSRHDPARLARVGFHTLLKMVFDDGFVHADLHPGNILVTEGGTVALLDLGLTAELDDDHRRAFANHFASWAGGDGKSMARIMSENSPRAQVLDYETYEREVEEFVARYQDKALGEVAVAEVIFDMMNILRRHRVRINATFTMCNIAIAMTEGIGKQLDPSLDLIQETLPFFVKLKAQGRL